MVAAINEPPNLNSCDLEPIHIPGSIQPHGLMLVVNLDDHEIVQVAGDVENRLGITGWAAQDLSIVVGAELAAKVAGLSQSASSGDFIGQLQTSVGETLDVSAHISDTKIIVELETASPAGIPGSILLQQLSSAAAEFEKSTSLNTLCDRASIEFRRLTNFDRVMIYRFLDDGVGCVMAEDRREDMHSFLNHHFPASDIPKQARDLYLRNLIRVIPDAAYQPIPLRPATSNQDLDMSDSALRSVSPVHIEYLKNMGVRASASISIVKDGLLWGLVACHHASPKAIACDVRAACLSLAGSLGQHIKNKEESEGYRQRIRLLSFEDDIAALLARDESGDALTNHLEEINRMMGSDGLAIIRNGQCVTFGVTPGKKDVFDLAEWHVKHNSEVVFWTEWLSELYPAGALFPELGSGVLILTVSEEDPWILLWFRAEQIETIKWAGNPHKLSDSIPTSILTPRASFEAWSQTVKGRSRRWTLAEVDAASRLRIALLDVVQNRRMRDLNRQLTATLQDKDTLLQQKEYLIGEVNHRVQNSLQLVSSFLALQEKASDDPGLQSALAEARRRLSAVALVHRRLYRGDSIGIVDLARYIEELCADTFSFKGQDWAQNLSLNLAPALVPTDHAVTLGLVLTELMINCSKHAYAGGDGPIAVELIQDRTHLQLAVSDKGSGKVVERRSGFGSRMMEGLVSQLGGALSYADNRPGLRTTLRIPIQSSAQPQ
jgi:two-component system, chemotaxis family, sensor kinase Cph1